MSKPKVIIQIQDGLVTSVLSDSELDIAIINYDPDGLGPGKKTGIFRSVDIPQGDGSTVNSYVYEHDVLEIDTNRTEQIFGAIL